jgi:hypothetical protein
VGQSLVVDIYHGARVAWLREEAPGPQCTSPGYHGARVAWLREEAPGPQYTGPGYQIVGAKLDVVVGWTGGRLSAGVPTTTPRPAWLLRYLNKRAYSQVGEVVLTL